MSSKKTLKLVMTAVMTALCFLATKLIQIPTPTGGYIHLGDGIVFTTGVILGPIYGSLASGIGAMFSDIASGYASYAIPTFVIKAISALIMSGFSKITLNFAQKKKKNIIYILGCLCASIVGVVGYFLVEAFVLGLGVVPALAGVFTNCIQCVIGSVVAIVLIPTLSKMSVIKEIRFGELCENK